MGGGSEENGSGTFADWGDVSSVNALSEYSGVTEAARRNLGIFIDPEPDELLQSVFVANRNYLTMTTAIPADDTPPSYVHDDVAG